MYYAELTRYQVLSTYYIYTSTSVAEVNSINVDNALLLCKSLLLYSISHFHIIPFVLGHASCMHSRTCIPAVI